MDESHVKGIRVAAILDWPGWLDQHRRVYDPDYCCPTLHTVVGNSTQVKVLIKGGPTE